MANDEVGTSGLLANGSSGVTGGLIMDGGEDRIESDLCVLCKRHAIYTLLMLKLIHLYGTCLE